MNDHVIVIDDRDAQFEERRRRMLDLLQSSDMIESSSPQETLTSAHQNNEGHRERDILT